MLLTEIDHIAIAVKDLEAAIAYYQNAFGATVDHREVVESDGVEEALLKVAESYIQLLTPTRPDSPVAKALEKRGEGLHHIGYRVANCADALAQMIAAIANANELMGYSCTNSISVPKLPFGCMNATVVPRLPGRGALSIAVAPAAIMAASASAQLFTR